MPDPDALKRYRRMMRIKIAASLTVAAALILIGVYYLLSTKV